VPIPKPKAGQTKNKFISSCMSELSGEYPETDQRYAICISSWEDKFSVARQVHEIKKNEHFSKLKQIEKDKR
jgi:hypothetical protein